VELVTALASGRDESGVLEEIEMLRDGLTRHREPMLRRQTGADLEERLALPLGQLVEDRAPRRVGQRFEDVADGSRLYASKYLHVNLIRLGAPLGLVHPRPSRGLTLPRRRRPAGALCSGMTGGSG
jgi:hypothetical protein